MCFLSAVNNLTMSIGLDGGGKVERGEGLIECVHINSFGSTTFCIVAMMFVMY